MSDIKEKKENPAIKYFKGVRSEFKKVTWPTVKQLKNNTTTVILAVIIVGIFIFALDSLFGAILKQFIK